MAARGRPKYDCPMTAEELESIRREVVAAVQGSTRLHIAFIGVTNALFEALAERGAMDPRALARATGRDAGYVTRWCDAAFAFGLLDEPEPGVFSLTALGDAFRPSAPGTLMPFAVQGALGAHMAERAAGLMKSGEQPGERVLAERETVLPWFGPMLEAQFGPFFDAHILASVPAYRDVDSRGGVVVDLGCGNAWYLRRLLSRFPHVRGIGLDGFEENVRGARALADAEGLSDRLDVRAGDIHAFAVDEPVDLIAMNRALHHVWSERDGVMSLLARSLAPGGWAVIWEPAWPSDRAALRDPAIRPLAFMNLSEHVQGNRFLRPEEIAEALARAGLEPTVHLFAEGREAVVTGRKPA